MPFLQALKHFTARTTGPDPAMEILEVDAGTGVLRGHADPALDATGRPSRVIHVEILDPNTGQSWYGQARSWSMTGRRWCWSFDLAQAVDTADSTIPFGSQPGTFEVLAYHESRDPETGRFALTEGAPVDLTISRPPAQPGLGVQAGPGADVLERLREMSRRHGPAPHPAAAPFAEDCFVFAS